MLAMRGDLTDTSVADLCRRLAETEATGSVEIQADGGSGRIFFRRGRVYWAMSSAPRARLGDRLVNAALLTEEQLDQALTAQARSDDGTKLGAILVQQELVTRDVIRVFVQEQILDALFDLMRMASGTFEFASGDAAEEKLPVDIPVAQMLVEVSRRQSEWDQIQQAIPDLDHVPDFVTEGTSSSSASLEPDEFTVLANVDGARSIRELAADLGYSEFEAARIVYGLLLLGVISIRPPVADGAEAGTDVEAEFDLSELEEAVAGAEDRDPGPYEADEPDEADATEAADDIAAALDEAFGTSAEPQGDTEPPTRPTVRVHVDDHGRFPDPSDADERDEGDEGDERIGPDDLTVAPRGEAPEPAAAGPDPGHLGEALAAALAEGEGDAGIDDAPDRDAALDDDEPEPWETGGTPDYGFFVGSGGETEEDGDTTSDAGDTEPPADEPAAPRRDLPDEDFERLINELAGGDPSPSGDEPHRTDAEEAPRPRPEEGADDLPEPQDGGDVSEFLRELSRLAVNDQDTDDEDRPPAGERRPRRTERPDEDDGKDDRKRRGLFGWGR